MIRRMIPGKAVWGLIAATALSACNLAPKYQRPIQPVQNSYPQDAGATAPLQGQAVSDIGWKHFFTDARLRSLIEIAIRNNRDLRSQAGSIMEAQGTYEVQHASLFPPIGVQGQGEYYAPSDQAGFSFAPGVGRGISMLRYYSLGIGFSSYEIDLFGRIRNLSRQQAEELALAALQRAFGSDQHGLASREHLCAMAGGPRIAARDERYACLTAKHASPNPNALRSWRNRCPDTAPDPNASGTGRQQQSAIHPSSCG